MKNFILSSLLILSFVLINIQISSAQSACAGYNDVQTGIWYCPALEFLQERGVLDKNSSFQPSQHLNRAEALKVLLAVKGGDLPERESLFFEIGGKWYTEYFQSAYAQGFIQSEDGKMSPSKEITKAEFVILFMQVFDIELQGSGSCSIGSSTVSSWINISEKQKNQYLCTAKEQGISNIFSEKFLERAVAMGVLYKGITGEEL